MEVFTLRGHPDTLTGRWEENRMRSLLQKRDYYVSVTLEEQVYVLGGYGSSSPYTTTEILLADSTT